MHAVENVVTIAVTSTNLSNGPPSGDGLDQPYKKQRIARSYRDLNPDRWIQSPEC